MLKGKRKDGFLDISNSMILGIERWEASSSNEVLDSYKGSKLGVLVDMAQAEILV